MIVELYHKLIGHRTVPSSSNGKAFTERERVKTTYIIVQSKIYEELYNSEEFKCDKIVAFQCPIVVLVNINF